MTHDPLCYHAEGKWDGGCQCELIAKVRADQDRIHLEEMQSLVLVARKAQP